MKLIQKIILRYLVIVLALNFGGSAIVASAHNSNNFEAVILNPQPESTVALPVLSAPVVAQNQNLNISGLCSAQNIFNSVPNILVPQLQSAGGLSMQGLLQMPAQNAFNLNPNLNSDCAALSIGKIQVQNNLVVENIKTQQTIVVQKNVAPSISAYTFIPGQQGSTSSQALNVPIFNFSQKQNYSLPILFVEITLFIGGVEFLKKKNFSMLQVWRC